MHSLFLASFLFILGLFFWSFASVIIYRLRHNESGIFFGRSHCPKCNHILWALELIPLFSYLKNKWKCKYCEKKIPLFYPILELSFWIAFSLVWYFLIDFNLIISWNLLEIFSAVFWLYIVFLSMILFFYDILYLEINELVMLLLIIPIFLVLIWQTFYPDFFIIKTLSSATDYISSTLVIASFISFFWILWLYTIILKELDLKWDFLILFFIIWIIILFKNIFEVDLSLIPILSGFIWALAIFIFFFLQIAISNGRWMGWWDLRIAIFMGLILWISFSFAWVMFSYILWSIIWVWIIIFNRMKKSKKELEKTWSLANTQVPFGPFLVMWLFTVLFFNQEITDLINKNFYL